MSNVHDDPGQESQRVLDAYRRLPRVGPPAALDAAVLAQARAAIVRPKVVTRRPRWLVPASIAATAVLVIGVASRLGREQGESAWPAQLGAPADKTSVPPENASAPATQAPATAKPRDSDVLDEKRQQAPETQPTEPSVSAARPQATAAPAGKDAKPQSEVSAAAESGRLERDRRLAAPKSDAAASKERAAAITPASPPAAASPQAFPDRHDGSADRISPAPPVVETKTQPRREQAKQETATAAGAAQVRGGENAPVAPLPERKSLAAPEAQNRETEQAPSQPASTAAAKRSELDAAAKTTSAVRMKAPMEEGVPGANARIEASERARPDTWIAAIRRILKAGDAVNARLELAEFRRRNPHAVIPDDLAALAE
jgi:hypothetical protein